MQDSVIGLVVVIMVLTFVALVIGSVQDSFAEPPGATENVSTAHWNVTVEGLDALQEFSDFLVPIALIVVIVVILGFVFLLSRRSGGSI